MKKYVYKKADAFTSGHSLGNPAACIYTGQDSLSESQMLQIAKQHKGFVSEVIYCSASDIADIKLIYYSSECEVDFCGHGTIAAIYELLRDNTELRQKEQITVETNKKGIIAVYNELESNDAVYITAPEPEYLQVQASPGAVAAALGMQESALLSNYPLAAIDAGLRTLIVPISTLKNEISLFPNQQTLKSFCLKQDVDIILIFCMETADAGALAHTRVFAPKFGYLEDPATGSGNSAFGYYLLRHKLWNADPISIEQGGNDRVYNTVKLKAKGGKVLFGGRASLRIDGYYYV